MSDKVMIQHVEQMDRGLAYAESCFETFRVVQGEVFQWTAHWQRLCRGLASFGIEMGSHQATQVLEQCCVAAKGVADDALVRLTVSGGEADWGLCQQATPRLLMQIMPVQRQTMPLHLMCVDYPYPLQDKIAKFSADYAEKLQFIHILKQKHPHLLPIQYIFRKNDELLGGLTSNMMIFHQNKWKTPQNRGILPGIMRQFLMDKGLVQLQTCPRAWLADCEAIVLLNCGQFMMPVTSIQGRILDTQHPEIQTIQHILSQEKGVSCV